MSSSSWKIFAAVAAIGVLAGCAKSADSIGAAYVSPMMYERWSCDQLREEAQRLSSRATIAAGEQNSKASNDAVATGVGVIIFWPALFFIKGDGQTAAELSRLKGEIDAIEQASIRKNCQIQFRRAPGQ